jgi:ATP-dependent Clp protease ATP-binding subunit ClpX
LRSIIEQIMLDVMYELPDEGRGHRYCIDEGVVQGRERLLPLPMPEPKTKSA